jgi:hypothetical protein
MPMTVRRKTLTHFLAAKLAFRNVVRLSVVLAFLTPGMVLCGQTIEIKIVNGRNGHPIEDKCMNVWAGDRSVPGSGPLVETQTDTNGIIKLRLGDENTKIEGQARQLVCGLQGIVGPSLKYGDTISVRTGFVLCQSQIPDYSWLAMTDFSTKQLIEHGIVTPNTCGKATASPKPGEAVLFVRPLTWWEKLKQ